MTKRTTTFTIKIQCNDLASLEATLDKTLKAARAGHLDWGHCDLTAELEFSANSNMGQDLRPLRDFIESQNSPFGVTCRIEDVTTENEQATPTCDGCGTPGPVQAFNGSNYCPDCHKKTTRYRDALDEATAWRERWTRAGLPADEIKELLESTMPYAA